tara:strand:+ start:633 stop:824 length:192 start_codon:yes stop_codon:yes gene_type:complete
MKLGDLVRYSNRVRRIDGESKELGIVTELHNNSVIGVLWNNGVESYHSLSTLMPIKPKTLEDR